MPLNKVAHIMERKIIKADVMYLLDLQDYRERVNGTARGYPLFDENGEPILTILHPAPRGLSAAGKAEREGKSKSRAAILKYKR